jgi:hypothetical protein
MYCTDFFTGSAPCCNRIPFHTSRVFCHFDLEPHVKSEHFIFNSFFLLQQARSNRSRHGKLQGCAVYRELYPGQHVILMRPTIFLSLSHAPISQVLQASSEVTEFSHSRVKSLNSSELQVPSAFADAVKKLGEPMIIKSSQVESTQKARYFLNIFPSSVNSRHFRCSLQKFKK